jgi:hypothetical protein
MKKNEISHFVERGYFQEAMELAQKQSRPPLNEDERSWFIGALSFRGHLEKVEEELVLKTFQDQLAHSRALFFASPLKYSDWPIISALVELLEQARSN